MPKKSALTQKAVRELLDYDPLSGVFRWKARPWSVRGWNTRNAGRPAGTVENGYVQIQVLGEFQKAHRLAFLWMTGRMPAVVDHKDMDRGNNRWGNLREANYTLNFANTRLKATNTSGVKGVHWHAEAGKWRARIQCRGVSRCLGLHDTKEEAAKAYAKAAAELFGEFARTT